MSGDASRKNPHCLTLRQRKPTYAAKSTVRPTDTSIVLPSLPELMFPTAISSSERERDVEICRNKGRHVGYFDEKEHRRNLAIIMTEHADSYPKMATASHSNDGCEYRATAAKIQAVQQHAVVGSMYMRSASTRLGNRSAWCSRPTALMLRNASCSQAVGRWKTRKRKRKLRVQHKTIHGLQHTTTSRCRGWCS